MTKRLVSQGTKIDPVKLAAWLEEHWKEKRCPICKSNNWSISDKALELREWQRHSMLQAPSHQIVAMLQCLVCGNVIFINPFIANLFEEEEEADLATVLASSNQR